MSKLKNCEVCGAEFRTEKGKYCYKKCRPRKNMNCVTCGKEFFALKTSEKFCCLKCRKINAENASIYRSKEKYPNGIECKICGLYSNALSFHISSKHNMTAKDYRQTYNSPTCSLEYSKKISENVSGKKNAWFNHKGTLSPFSKNNSKLKGKTEKEKSDIISKNIEKFIKSIPRENRPMNLEYWIKRGFSEEDALKLQRDRQSTFSLEKCIKKYGEIEGLKKMAG